MELKTRTLQAITAVMAKQTLKRVTTVGVIIAIMLIIIIAALAYYLSGWWWLLLLAYIPLVAIALVVRAIAKRIIGKIYPDTLSKEQESSLLDLVGKTEALAEKHSTNWQFFAMRCAMDFVFKRNMQTLKNEINTFIELKDDFLALEKSLEPTSQVL